MADEKSKNLTDTEQKTPPVLDKAKVARGTPVVLCQEKVQIKCNQFSLF